MSSTRNVLTLCCIYHWRISRSIKKDMSLQCSTLETWQAKSNSIESWQTHYCPTIKLKAEKDEVNTKVASPDTTVFRNSDQANMFDFEVIGWHTKMPQDVSHLKPENYYANFKVQQERYVLRMLHTWNLTSTALFNRQSPDTLTSPQCSKTDGWKRWDSVQNKGKIFAEWVFGGFWLCKLVLMCTLRLKVKFY